jgi:hypothetical protein
MFLELQQAYHMHTVQLSTRETRMEVINEVQALQISSLMNLLSIPTFISTQLVQWCINVLMSRVHLCKLWIEQAYSFSLRHVQDLTGLSMDELEVPVAF